MRLAVVIDQPSQARTSRDIVSRALAMSQTKAEIVIVPATTLPGGKAPGIAQVRSDLEPFWERLEAAGPDRVLAMGAISLTQMLRSHSKAKIYDHRGMMMRGTLPSGREILWVPTGAAGGVITWPDMFKDIVDDAWKACTQEPHPEILRDDGTVDWRVETVPALAFDALGEFDGASAISCDIETGGLSPWDDELWQVGFGASYGDGTTMVRIIHGAEALNDPSVQDRMWDLIFSRSHVSVFHNGKFDLQFLMRLYEMDRVDPAARIGDTMLLHHLLDERPVGKMAGSVHALKTLARVYYDQPDYSWDHGKWQEKVRAGLATEQDWDDFHWYHARDCHFTIRLWEDLRREAEAEPGLNAFHDALQGRASAVLAGCELRGVPLDLNVANRLCAEKEATAAELAEKLLAHPEVAGRSIKLNTPESIQDLLFGADGWALPAQQVTKPKAAAANADKTGTTDISSLQAMHRWCTNNGEPGKAEWIGLLLDYRQDTKDVASFLRPLMASVKERRNGTRIHPSFWLAGTVTGRLSSSNPSVQNMPGAQSAARGRARNVKHAFRPAPDWKWVEVDYSQLELRIAAALCADPNLLKAFEEGWDLHRIVAANMYQKAPEDVTKAERFTAKAIDFGILYGRSAWAIAHDEEIDRMMRGTGHVPPDEEQAKVFIERFLDQFPGLRDWLVSMERQAYNQGWVPIGPGRRRRWLYQNRDKSDYMARKHMREIQRQARNGPIQGLASDVCVDAMCRIEARLPDEGVELLFPVHDSICFVVRDDLIESTIALAREEMTKPPSWFDLNGVKLSVDAKIGPSWGEAGDL